MKPSNDQMHQYLKGRLTDYITSKPECDLEWIRRKIFYSGISSADLANVFMELKAHVDNNNFRIIFDICRAVDFNYSSINNF